MPKHYRRCETCTFLWKKECPYYAWIEQGNVGISADSYIEFTSIVGCCCHSTYETDPLGINDQNSPAYIAAKQYSQDCQEKFRRENPCPKCGSHNTDIDWGTPRFCRDCGYEW